MFAEFWLGDKQKANSYAPKIFAQGKGPDGKKTSKRAFEGPMNRLFASNKILSRSVDRHLRAGPGWHLDRPE